jgi:hypothetical protein
MCFVSDVVHLTVLLRKDNGTLIKVICQYSVSGKFGMFRMDMASNRFQIDFKEKIFNKNLIFTHKKNLKYY